MSIRRRLLPLLLAFTVCIAARSPAFAGPRILVNSATADNLVAFDLVTGAAAVIGVYPGDWNPRNLAVDAAGVLYSSLNQGTQNIVKLVPQSTGLLAPVSFTADIGGFGPGQIQFHNGKLYAAGDASRRIFEYDGVTGALLGSFSSSTSYNIRAMAISDAGQLYYSEIFQDRVRRFDLTITPPAGGTLFEDAARLDESQGMALGPSGRLVLTNRASTLLQEYDAQTGAFLRTLADVATFDAALTAARDIYFSPQLNNYVVSAGSKVFRLSADGALLQTYASPLLVGTATGVIIVDVPEPSALALAAVATAPLAAGVLRRKRANAAPRIPRA